MKTMPKNRIWRTFLLAAVMTVCCLVCGSMTASAEAPEPFSPEDSVIFEKDGVTVRTAGLGLDPTDGEIHPVVWLDITNANDSDAFLGVTEGAVNGFMADVLLLDFYEEDGAYIGADYTFDLTVPANSSGRYAVSYYKNRAPGVDMDTLDKITFCFTMAEEEGAWPDYRSEPVTIVTGQTVEAVDIADLGTTVRDDDTLLLVIGGQDYDEFFGPQIWVYAENRTDAYIGLTADTAEADGTLCDYVYYYEAIAPGKRSAGMMCFEDALRGMKGFEELTLVVSLREAPTKDGLDEAEAKAMDAVIVSYPPQIWGEYENGGLSLEIQPRYNDLITVVTHEKNDRGLLFTVSETTSLEAGGYEGAGWLFSIGTIDEAKLHEMLCYDMSGADVFAKDGEGTYYVYYHPTDVRVERSSPEEYESGFRQWSMLCEWAAGMPEKLRDKNELEFVSFGNTEVDMYVARAAWMEGDAAVLATTEYGPIALGGVDGSPWVDFVMQGAFCDADLSETPDGEYVVLDFPQDELRVDFFFAPGNYARVVSGDQERLYQAMWYDEDISFAEAMQGWYYALAELGGLRPADDSLAPFLGDWEEKDNGGGRMTVSPGLAPGKVLIEVVRPEGGTVRRTWKMTAALTDDGGLVYENGVFEVFETDESGYTWQVDDDIGMSGELIPGGDGELCWRDRHAEDEKISTFIR